MDLIAQKRELGGADLQMVVAESKRVVKEKRLKMVLVIAVINLVSSLKSITLKYMILKYNQNPDDSLIFIQLILF